MLKLKTGIVGCGAIGTSLAKSIVSDLRGSVKLCALFDVDQDKSWQLALALRNKKLAVISLEKCLRKADVIIEATHPDSSLAIALRAVSKGKSVIVLSVGGLIKGFKKLQESAKKKSARVYIPSGAVCAVDGLKSASMGRIHSVTLTTVKPARAFRGVGYVTNKGINVDALTRDTVLFQGRAERAIALFPQNINVAATLSLAGIGIKRTLVRIIASAKASSNTHRIEIRSESGTIRCEVNNVVHPDNPKTSYLAVVSALATLKQIAQPVRVGT